MEQILLGTAINISGEFKRADGTLFDPPTVTFKVRKPDGTEAAYVYGTAIVVVRAALGKYNMDYLPATAGRYTSRLVSSGATADKIANEQSFDVTGSKFTTP
jgi:hypothetical protein